VPKWTNKQKLFVEAYLQCWNATEAARRAGYSGSSATLAVMGSENLRKPKIIERIKKRLTTEAMAADEVLHRLGEQARASADDFIIVDDKGVWRYDLVRARDKGKLHLIKKLWTDKDGHTRLELHDAQAALVHLGRHHKLFTDKQEHDISPRLYDVLAALPDDFREAVRQYLADALRQGESTAGH
jgi:phage terminase small subunit